MTTEPEHTVPGPGLTVPLTAADAVVLGDDAEMLAELLAGALHGVALLRTGGACAQDLAAVIEDVVCLTERLDGVRDAAVRRHAGQGGTYGALAKAMGVTRATAQSRRDALLKSPVKPPSAMEQWATGSG